MVLETHSYAEGNLMKLVKVVMNTVYIPYKDSDHSGSNGIYNDPRMLVSTEFDVNKVATCVGCHFKCNNCEDK